MEDIESLIKDTVLYKKDGNIIHFIIDENARPYWSKTLNQYLTIFGKRSVGLLFPYG